MRYSMSMDGLSMVPAAAVCREASSRTTLLDHQLHIPSQGRTLTYFPRVHGIAPAKKSYFSASVSNGSTTVQYCTELPASKSVASCKLRLIVCVSTYRRSSVSRGRDFSSTVLHAYSFVYYVGTALQNRPDFHALSHIGMAHIC